MCVLYIIYLFLHNYVSVVILNSLAEYSVSYNTKKLIEGEFVLFEPFQLNIQLCDSNVTSTMRI